MKKLRLSSQDSQIVAWLELGLFLPWLPIHFSPCGSWECQSCTRKVILLPGKGRRLGKWCHRILLIAPRKNRTTEKGPVWNSFGDRTKLRITNMNNCNHHYHWKTDTMMTVICIIYVGLFLFFEMEGEKGCLECPSNLNENSGNDFSSLRLVLKDTPPNQTSYLLRRE